MQIRKAPRRCLSSWAEDHEGRPYKVEYEGRYHFFHSCFTKPALLLASPSQVAVETTDLQAPNFQTKRNFALNRTTGKGAPVLRTCNFFLFSHID